jgi:hypothetical protein
MVNGNKYTSQYPKYGTAYDPSTAGDVDAIRLSLIFDFDIRWITVCGIWLSVILCVLPIWKKLPAAIFLMSAFLILLAWLHTNDDNGVIELTEEGVVFFYYSLLATALVLNNPWLLGISVATCLLSRYSFIGWIPFTVLYLL